MSNEQIDSFEKVAELPAGTLIQTEGGEILRVSKISRNPYVTHDAWLECFSDEYSICIKDGEISAAFRDIPPLPYTVLDLKDAVRGNEPR